MSAISFHSKAYFHGSDISLSELKASDDRIQAQSFKILKASPQKLPKLCDEIRKWEKIIISERERNLKFYDENDPLYALADAAFICDMAKDELKDFEKVSVLRCTQGSQLKGLLLYKKNRERREKNYEIEVQYLLTHPDNVTCRLKNESSPSKGAGKFLMEALQRKAVKRKHCTGIYLQATRSSFQFYVNRLGFEPLLGTKMFWSARKIETQAA